MPRPSCKPGWRQQWEGPGHIRSTTSWGYLECLASGGKSAKILLQVLQAVRFMEAAGEVAAPRVASATPQSRTTSCAEHEISGDQETKARKGKAPMIPVMVLFALELVVLDTIRPLYVRGFAWVKLLKFWASLRYDDLQWLPPASMVLTAAGLHATLPRTKTSAPGKRAATLTATISSDAPRWLAEGFAFWKHFETDRDYLLPCPTPDLQGVRDCYASFYDAAALSQALYNESRFPSELQGAGRFWTEHSERNGLTSMGAALGFGSAKAFGTLDDRLL